MPQQVAGSDRIQKIIRILRKEVRQWAIPAIGNYVDTPFTVLISCVLSLRTQDKTTNTASERLFAIADTPLAMLNAPVAVIQKAIYPVSFYRVKAKTIHVRLGHLFEAAVKVADLRIRIDDLLAVDCDLKPKGAVHCRMLRTNIQDLRMRETHRLGIFLRALNDGQIIGLSTWCALPGRKILAEGVADKLRVCQNST